MPVVACVKHDWRDYYLVGGLGDTTSEKIWADTVSEPPEGWWYHGWVCRNCGEPGFKTREAPDATADGI